MIWGLELHRITVSVMKIVYKTMFSFSVINEMFQICVDLSNFFLNLFECFDDQSGAAILQKISSSDVVGDTVVMTWRTDCTSCDKL